MPYCRSAPHQRLLPEEVDVLLFVPIQREALRARVHHIEVWRDIRDEAGTGLGTSQSTRANHHVLPALPRWEELGHNAARFVPEGIEVEPLFLEGAVHRKPHGLRVECGPCSLDNLLAQGARPIDECGIGLLRTLLRALIVEGNRGLLSVDHGLLGEGLDIGIAVGGDAESLGGEDTFSNIGEFLLWSKRNIGPEGFFTLVNPVAVFVGGNSLRTVEPRGVEEGIAEINSVKFVLSR